MSLWKRLIWTSRVNAAIGAMGVPPTLFDGKTRGRVQDLGWEAELTPQETAVVLVSLTLRISYPLNVAATLGHWHADDKIDFEKPEMIDALYDMGFSVDDPPWYMYYDDITNDSLKDEDIRELGRYVTTDIARLFAQIRYKEINAAMALDTTE